MEAEKDLTAFAANGALRAEVAALLAEAGLEMWQAPEGFWAIRVKPVASLAKPSRRRRPRRVA
jgi:hypothetical protein